MGYLIWTKTAWGEREGKNDEREREGERMSERRDGERAQEK